MVENIRSLAALTRRQLTQFVTIKSPIDAVISVNFLLVTRLMYSQFDGPLLKLTLTYIFSKNSIK
jgi:hypothetical protein